MGLFDKPIDILKETALDGISALQPLLVLMKDDPALALSVLQTAKGILNDGVIWISEGMIEDHIVSTLEEQGNEIIKAVGCCGLDSNRLLIYGEGSITKCDFSFRVLLEPASPSVNWGIEQKKLCLTMSPPKIEGENLAARASQKAVKAILGLVLPGFFGGLAQFALKKMAETVMLKRWKQQLSLGLPGCSFEGDIFSLDLAVWEATRNILTTALPETKYTPSICLADTLSIEALSFTRHGVALSLQTNKDSELIQGIETVWGVVLDWGK